MRSGGNSDTDSLHDAANDAASIQSWQDPDDNLNDETDEDVVNQSETVETDSLDGESDVGGGLRSGRRHPFFQRSDSTIFLGCSPPDPFQVPLVEALPLADQPHLLHPYARKEELFGVPRQTVSTQSLVGSDTTAVPAGRTNPSQWPFDHLPTHMALSYRSAGSSSVLAGTGVSHTTAVGDVFGMMTGVPSQSAPPAHVAPPPTTDTSLSLAPESSVIVQPQTSAVAPPCPSYAANPEPTYLGVASAHAPSGSSSVKSNSGSESAEPISVESIPLPAAGHLLSPLASPAYTQPLYMNPHQQPSVIVHRSTSSSHLGYHSEPLELSMSAHGGESSSSSRDLSSRLRSPPAYDDLQASNNVCLDLTNPYRSAAVEISTAVTGTRTSSSTSETIP